MFLIFHMTVVRLFDSNNFSFNNVEAALNAELDEHLGYDKHHTSAGFSSKMLKTEDGQFDVDIPRDRHRRGSLARWINLPPAGMGNTHRSAVHGEYIGTT